MNLMYNSTQTMQESEGKQIIVNGNLLSDIKQKIQNILDREFVSYKKRTLEEKHDRFNFACPYCGDSTVEERKKRGNLFFESMYFHCFNDGCKKHRSLPMFLGDFGESLDSDGHFAVVSVIRNHQKIGSSIKEFTIASLKALDDLSIPRDSLFSFFGMDFITKESKRVYPYLYSRVLHKYTRNFAYNSRKQVLYILNYNHSKDSIIGFQIRNLNPKPGQPRYYTFTLSKIRNLMGLDISYDNLVKLDKLSTVYNLLGFDIGKEFTVFEGPIDSMFISNSIAISGVEKEPFSLDEIPTARYFFDNDEAGRRKMIEKLKAGKKVFLWEKYLKDKGLMQRKIKDLNDLVKIAFHEKKRIFTDMESYFDDDPRSIILM